MPAGGAHGNPGSASPSERTESPTPVRSAPRARRPAASTQGEPDGHAEPAGYGESGILADRLHSSAIHLLRRLRRTDPLTGVSAAQLSALSVLMGGPRTLGELAAAEQVQPPTMSRLVRELAGAGLVTRTRDATDARVVWIEWTEDGRRVLQKGRELRVQTLEAQIRGLPAADRKVLARALAILERLGI